MKRELKTFDDPRNVKRLLMAFFTVLAVLVIADFFVDKHGDFSWENFPAFFAAYGFVSYVTLIYVAKGLRLLVKRDEDHYE